VAEPNLQGQEPSAGHSPAGLEAPVPTARLFEERLMRRFISSIALISVLLAAMTNTHSVVAQIPTPAADEEYEPPEGTVSYDAELYFGGNFLEDDFQILMFLYFEMESKSLAEDLYGEALDSFDEEGMFEESNFKIRRETDEVTLLEAPSDAEAPGAGLLLREDEYVELWILSGTDDGAETLRDLYEDHFEDGFDDNLLPDPSLLPEGFEPFEER
jgi:hypothetical protein